MSKKRGLGKGLDALIPAGTGAAMPGEGVAQVPVEAIRPNPRQPRESMDTQALEDLAQSIREHGVLQPLIVLPADAQGSYTLIAGERRLRAAAMAGLKEVPAIIREATEAQRLELALIENLQRSDLNPLEAAEGYRQLAEDFGLSHEEIATRVGKSRTAVTNTLRLLKLSAAVRKALMAAKISEGHARALLALPTAQAQSAALQGILSRELNVRQTEELVRSMLGERPRRKKKVPDRSAEEVALEEELRQALGTKVTLRRGRRGGRLVLHFYSDEELNALVEQLLAQAKKD
ncbi:MAG TPA: ParB/RepB/Spo0J family partition protein [Chloroflexi bacterium]|nr:ParB/RepB/Spo0J family partition protein [Chloroflexota bacterium]